MLTWKCSEKMSGYILEVNSGDLHYSYYIDRYRYNALPSKHEWFDCTIALMTRYITSAMEHDHD
jgi:hypothetical protein